MFALDTFRAGGGDLGILAMRITFDIRFNQFSDLSERPGIFLLHGILRAVAVETQSIQSRMRVRQEGKLIASLFSYLLITRVCCPLGERLR